MKHALEMFSFKNSKGTMGAHQKFLRQMAVLFLNALFAVAALSATHPIQIKVIRSDVHTLNSQTPVPKDCDLQNFSAYCNSSTSATEQVVMLVLEDDGKYYNISCYNDSRWSNCSPLPEGETFEARVEKNGLMVIFRTPKGKQRKQLFQVVGPVPPPQTDAAADFQPPAAVPQRNSPAPAAAPAAPAPPVGAIKEILPNKVRCNFNSIPAGAEITLDGKYVGNTPSAMGLSMGTHVIILSLPGFIEWKRELTVTPGSDLTVSTTLQKAQQ